MQRTRPLTIGHELARSRRRQCHLSPLAIGTQTPGALEAGAFAEVRRQPRRHGHTRDRRNTHGAGHGDGPRRCRPEHSLRLLSPLRQRLTLQRHLQSNLLRRSPTNPLRQTNPQPRRSRPPQLLIRVSTTNLQNHTCHYTTVTTPPDVTTTTRCRGFPSQTIRIST